MRLGTIKSGAWRYELTKEDLLWAARMVEGETIAGRPNLEEDALAVLWTMATLFTPEGQRAKYGRRRFHTFTDQIRAYSQPINPRWLEDGEFCRPGGRNHGTDACTATRLAARARLQQTPWKQLDTRLRELVTRWARGRTTNPVPGAIEFAADPVARSFQQRHPGAQIRAELQNTFLSVAETERTSPSIEQPRASLTVPVLIATAASGLAAWAIVRALRAGAH